MKFGETFRPTVGKINNGKYMEWFLKVMRQYADFNGRARRKEYWMFYLFSMIFSVTAVILDTVLGIEMNGLGYGPLYMLFCLAVIIPNLAVAVRRLHDVNKSGWMFFVVLIPIAGAIWLLVLFCTEGDHGDNKYGPNPKSDEQFIAQA